MKILFVVQRYGTEISGGAEMHCRMIAERMALLGREVHVYTTCARDYMTWTDVYAPGEEVIQGVTVHRFRVDAPRDVAAFNNLSNEVYTRKSGKAQEEAWMRAQGPYSAALLTALEQDKENYRWVIFYNYLYCTTYFGLPICSEKAILAPMAHDEPPIYLEIFDAVFEKAQALLFNTEEERDFIQTRFNVKRKPSVLVGTWAPEPLNVSIDEAFWRKAGFISAQESQNNFLVYIGRIDASKGCEELVKHFIAYKRQYPSNCKLLLMGTGDMHIPYHRDVVAWGFATEHEKWQALRGASASVIPSLYESLSISLLESFVVGCPVIVNERCAVTLAHCKKSSGGLWYGTAEEFAGAAEYLRTQPEEARMLGHNGKRYVQYNYTWEKVIGAYEAVFEKLEEARAA